MSKVGQGQRGSKIRGVSTDLGVEVDVLVGIEQRAIDYSGPVASDIVHRLEEAYQMR